MPRRDNRFLSDSDVKIIAKAQKLVSEVTAEDLANLTLPRESIYNRPKSTAKYTTKGKSAENRSWGTPSHATHAPGGPPPQYTAVELLEDLRQALSREPIDAEEVLGPYMKLSAMLNR